MTETWGLQDDTIKKATMLLGIDKWEETVDIIKANSGVTNMTLTVVEVENPTDDIEICDCVTIATQTILDQYNKYFKSYY